MAQFGNVVGQQIPVNQKLWDMLVLQAKHRFRTYPSMAASHWIHEQYVKHGGQFTKSKEDTPEGKKLRAKAKGDAERKKRGMKVHDKKKEDSDKKSD
jgi:hypothetical protein